MTQQPATLAPTVWRQRAACTDAVTTFDDPMQTELALSICAACPVVDACRDWSLATAVAGVSGGMTETGRRAWRFEHGVSEPLVYVEDFLPAELVVLDEPHGRRGQGLARRAVVLDAVESWTARGESAREIGSRLGVTSRTVVRLRRACRQRDAA